MTIKKFYLAGPVVNFPYGLNPADVESGKIKLPDDDGSGLNHHLLGQSFELELYPDRFSRDASLGYVDGHIEYKAVLWEQIEAYSISQMAVGPKMHEKGFEQICETIFPFVAFNMFDFCDAGTERIEINIGRVKYVLGLGDESMMYYPVYDQEFDEVEALETAKWLMARFRSFVPNRPESQAEYLELRRSLRGQLLRLEAYERNLV